MFFRIVISRSNRRARCSSSNTNSKRLQAYSRVVGKCTIYITLPYAPLPSFLIFEKSGGSAKSVFKFWKPKDSFYQPKRAIWPVLLLLVPVPPPFSAEAEAALLMIGIGIEADSYSSLSLTAEVDTCVEELPQSEIFVSTLSIGVSLLSSSSASSSAFFFIYDTFALPSKLFSLAECGTE